jgi:hypothetical protein
MRGTLLQNMLQNLHCDNDPILISILYLEKPGRIPHDMVEIRTDFGTADPWYVAV